MRTAIVALEIFIPLYIFRLNAILKKKTQNHSYSLTAKQSFLIHNETFLMLRVEATDALVGYAVEFLTRCCCATGATGRNVGALNLYHFSGINNLPFPKMLQPV